MAVVEKGTRTPLGGIGIVELEKPSVLRGSLRNLLDEQQTFEYAPSFLSGFYFDEIYHARTAYEQLHRMEHYENTHPPLGKLLIASGIALFGMNSFGWRVPGTLVGAAMIPLMYLFGLKLFRQRFIAFCAAFLMMVDFMHFTHSRIAVIDVYGAFFVILMYYFMYDYYVSNAHETGLRRSLVPLFLSGLCFGLGAAAKWISLYAGAGLALLLLLQKVREFRDYRRVEGGAEGYFRQYLLPTLGWCLLFFVVVPAMIYGLSYIPFLLVKDPPHGLLDILRNQRDMFNYHSQLKATHPFSSPWWSWPLDKYPIWLYTGSDLPPGQASSIVSFGNPVIWWTGIPAVLAAAAIAVKRRDSRMAVVFTGLACQYLPWAIIPRMSFIYHFFSVAPFMILSQVYVIRAAMEKWPRTRYAAYTYLVLAALLFVIFYPVLSGAHVPATYVERLRWFKTWIF